MLRNGGNPFLREKNGRIDGHVAQGPPADWGDVCGDELIISLACNPTPAFEVYIQNTIDVLERVFPHPYPPQDE